MRDAEEVARRLQEEQRRLIEEAARISNVAEAMAAYEQAIRYVPSTPPQPAIRTFYTSSGNK